MTQAYPEEQYIRVWICVAIILIITATTMAAWRVDRRIEVIHLGRHLLTAATGFAIVTLLSPWSVSAKAYWLLICSLLAGIGLTLRRIQGERSVSNLSLVSIALAVGVGSLWVVPYGHHSFVADRVPRILHEPGTVAMSTKLPWTIVLLVAFFSYFGARSMRNRLPAKATKTALVVTWLLAPLFLIYLILRDPNFDMGHVFSTDLPIFLAFAILGSILLVWLTKPTVGELGRIVAAAIIVTGVGSFLIPMRMVVRILLILLGTFSLAAPSFAGGKIARKRYTICWIASAAVLSWLITAVNTPSTVKVPGDFFLGGFSLTLFVAVLTIVISFPLGVLLALARTSKMPIFRLLATWFIEFVRGIPLITILFFFSIMVPLFLPVNMHLTEVAAVVIGYALFSSAYLAENVRGGLQSVTRGQHEAAEAVGMTTAQKTAFIVLPQALRVAIPPLVGHCIGVFKETSLLAIIGLFDVLYIARNVLPNQTAFMGSTRENLLFVSLLYWLFCYQMSKSSQRLERRVGLGER